MDYCVVPGKTGKSRDRVGSSGCQYPEQTVTATIKMIYRKFFDILFSSIQLFRKSV